MTSSKAKRRSRQAAVSSHHDAHSPTGGRFHWSPRDMVADPLSAQAVPGADWLLDLSEWKHILQVLQDFTEHTWAQIAAMEASGSPRNHAQDTATLNPAMRDLYRGISDQAYRLRLSGAGRLWGHRVGDVFYPMVFDRGHQVYEVHKHHT